MAAPLTEAAIESLRALIRTGDLVPGQRLPAEAALSAQLGVSRSSLREAVRALVTAGVLDVRRGDGTYVKALTPQQLFTSIGEAVELMRDDSLLELMECRRVVEPEVTALAAQRRHDRHLEAAAEQLELMRLAVDEADMVAHDALFHAAVNGASGNGALSAILQGISGITLRARVWRALTEADAAQRTLLEHQAIFDAVRDGDPARARAAALLHVHSVESWMRTSLGSGADSSDV